MEDISLPPWLQSFTLEAGMPLPKTLDGFASEGHGFVVLLDASLVPNLTDIIRTSGLDAECLFSGRPTDQLADVAPWLVKVNPDSTLFSALFYNTGTLWDIWGNSRFVLLQTERTLSELRGHFRGFLRYVDNQPSNADHLAGGGKRGTLFRFYDAMILTDWLAGTVDYPDRVAALMAFDKRGKPLVRRFWMAEDRETQHFLAGDLQELKATILGPRPLDEIDRAALSAGVDRRLISRNTERLAPKFAQLDPSRSHDTRNYVRASLDWLRYWGVSPNEPDDVFQLAFLAFMLGDARDTVMRGPVMWERLIPVSQRISMTRDSLLSEMKRVKSEEEA